MAGMDEAGRAQADKSEHVIVHVTEWHAITQMHREGVVCVLDEVHKHAASPVWDAAVSAAMFSSARSVLRQAAANRVLAEHIRVLHVQRLHALGADVDFPLLVLGEAVFLEAAQQSSTSHKPASAPVPGPWPLPQSWYGWSLSSSGSTYFSLVAISQKKRKRKMEDRRGRSSKRRCRA